MLVVRLRLLCRPRGNFRLRGSSKETTSTSPVRLLNSIQPPNSRDSYRNHVSHHTSPPGYAAYARHVHPAEPEAVHAPDRAHDGTCAGKLSAREAPEIC